MGRAVGGTVASAGTRSPGSQGVSTPVAENLSPARPIPAHPLNLAWPRADTRAMAAQNTTLLFRHAPMAVLVLNRDGQIVDANAEALKHLAERRADLVGSPILGVILPEDRDRAKEHFLEALAGRERDWTARVRRGDGAHRVLAFRAVPFEDEHGAIHGLVLFGRDMTESRGGRPETLQLQTLLENLPGQFALTLDPSGRVRYSSGLSRTHYRDDTDSVGLRYTELLDDGDENQARAAAMVEALLEGDDWAGTHWHRRKDDTVFPVRVFASPYKDPRTGRILGGIVACRDVAVEYDLRHRTERAERLAAMGNMTAGVAEHLARAADRLESALEGFLAQANGDGLAVQRELSGIRAYLDSMRAYAGDVALERRELRIDRVVDQVLDQLEERIEALGVVVDREGPAELRPAYVDVNHTLSAVEAVLGNALDALETVSGRTRRIRVHLQEAPDGVLLRIGDNGPGIPGEWQDRVFEPFYSTRPGRAGLGLTRVRELLKACGGRIWVEPEVDGWTTLAMEFPFQAPDAAFPFRPVPLTLNRKKSILIVDDEDAVRSGIRRFLEKVGYDVREAWSGRSALAQITTGQPPELVLTDLKMSDGSGYWFLDQLSRDFPNLLERTLILTGDTEHAEVSRLARRTGCPILRKPLELPNLLETLDRVAHRD